MCTSVLYANDGISYFGRNLDLQFAMGTSVTVTPRNYPFKFQETEGISSHAAMVGMSIVADDGYPLYFEVMNEYGVGIAGLNFSGFAKYNDEKVEGKINLGSFELMQYLLCTAKSVEDIKEMAQNINVRNINHSAKYQASPLHWLCADATHTLVLEPTANGLQIYENPTKVLTNQPDFISQYYNFCNYMGLTSDYPTNRMAPKEDLEIFGTGMGSNGLPGGLSSVERFVRAGFTVANSKSDATDEACLTQYFHIMQSVAQANGCDQVEDKLYEITQYTCGTNLGTMDFYWTTYNNQQICGLHTKALDLDTDKVMTFPVSDKQGVAYIN